MEHARCETLTRCHGRRSARFIVWRVEVASFLAVRPATLPPSARLILKFVRRFYLFDLTLRDEHHSFVSEN